jgi:hypothetical protein
MGRVLTYWYKSTHQLKAFFFNNSFAPFCRLAGRGLRNTKFSGKLQGADAKLQALFYAL